MQLSTSFFKPHQWILVHLLVYLQFTKVESRWNALNKHNSAHGFQCVTPCMKRDLISYGCYIAENVYSDKYGNWDFCSPRPGRSCTNEMCTSPCTKYSNHHSCNTISSTEYCGEILSEPANHHHLTFLTILGQQCIDECKTWRREDWYSSCHIDDDSVSYKWNYCSVDLYHDIYGRECENRCGFNGRNQTWCNLKSGSWGVCGSQVMSSATHYTTLGSKCVADCEVGYYGNGVSRNSCYDATRRKRYCSIAPGLTVDNRQCVTGMQMRSPLANGTKDLYWCRTEGQGATTTWEGLSGPVFQEGDKFDGLGRRQEKSLFGVLFPLHMLHTGLSRNVYNFENDLGNVEITFYEQVAHPREPYPVSRNIREWAFEALSGWAGNGYFMSAQNSARLGLGGDERNGVRLDQQGRINRGGVVYLKLQLQVNGVTPRELGGRSTTIGGVTVQETVLQQAPRRVRDALVRSMFQGYMINIGRFGYNSTRRG